MGKDKIFCRRDHINCVDRLFLLPYLCICPHVSSLLPLGRFSWKSVPGTYKKICREICGNKMPTRCNRGFYFRSYCLLNIFRAPLCPSSGAQEYYTVVAACGISCCGFQVVGLVCSWGLCVRFAGCCSTKYHRQQPRYNTLELPMMGIVVPETCRASNKICNKNLCCT